MVFMLEKSLPAHVRRVLALRRTISKRKQSAAMKELLQSSIVFMYASMTYKNSVVHSVQLGEMLFPLAM